MESLWSGWSSCPMRPFSFSPLAWIPYHQGCEFAKKAIFLHEQYLPFLISTIPLLEPCLEEMNVLFSFGGSCVEGDGRALSSFSCWRRFTFPFL